MTNVRRQQLQDHRPPRGAVRLPSEHVSGLVWTEFVRFRSARSLVNKHERWQRDLSDGYFVLTLGGGGARARRAGAAAGSASQQDRSLGTHRSPAQSRDCAHISGTEQGLARSDIRREAGT